MSNRKLTKRASVLAAAAAGVFLLAPAVASAATITYVIPHAARSDTSSKVWKLRVIRV
jgi:hypothetical protein